MLRVEIIIIVDAQCMVVAVLSYRLDNDTSSGKPSLIPKWVNSSSSVCSPHSVFPSVTGTLTYSCSPLLVREQLRTEPSLVSDYPAPYKPGTRYVRGT